MIRLSFHEDRRRLELHFDSDPANIAPARKAVEAFAAECAFDPKSCEEIGLAVNEALANVTRHAYCGAADQPVIVLAEAGAESLGISIRDWGNGVNPMDLPPKPVDPLQPGGLGVLCMKQLMDEVVFTGQGDGMLLSMTRRRPAQRGAHRKTRRSA
jgi:anti-sigma regulatory factor (Ser/Thr protein kinase)